MPVTGTQFGDGLVTALDKIHALLPKKTLHHFAELDDTLLVRSLAQPDYSRRGKEIRILNEAIARRRVLKVHYLPARLGKLCDWTLRPYGLVLFGMNLYCIGHVEQEDQVRVLKVIRIQGAETTARTFRRPEGFSLSEHLHVAFGVFAAGRPQTVSVCLTDWAATNVREQQWHPTRKIIEDGRDHVVVRFHLSDTTEFKRWILGFGRCARVIQPKSLADQIAVRFCGCFYDKDEVQYDLDELLHSDLRSVYFFFSVSDGDYHGPYTSHYQAESRLLDGWEGERGARRTVAALPSGRRLGGDRLRGPRDHT